MKVLIVYAHPEPQSFNGAMRDTAVAVLSGAGHQVQVSDLYAMQFNPIVSPAQFADRLDPAQFSLKMEQRHAGETGTTDPEVAAEHAKLFWADLVIFQFPLWWGSMPAIMKGWIDRVFSDGTIYGRDTVGLTGRRALVSVTASGQDPVEGAKSVRAELSHVFDNMLALAKLEALQPYFVFGPARMDDAQRASALEAYSRYLLTI